MLRALRARSLESLSSSNKTLLSAMTGAVCALFIGNNDVQTLLFTVYTTIISEFDNAQALYNDIRMYSQQFKCKLCTAESGRSDGQFRE